MDNFLVKPKQVITKEFTLSASYFAIHKKLDEMFDAICKEKPSIKTDWEDVKGSFEGTLSFDYYECEIIPYHQCHVKHRMDNCNWESILHGRHRRTILAI